MNYNKLTPEQERVIIHKATEAPFTDEYDNFYEDGTFICWRCNSPLFSSKSKFDARCGWPSFDEGLPNAIKQLLFLIFLSIIKTTITKCDWSRLTRRIRNHSLHSPSYIQRSLQTSCTFPEILWNCTCRMWWYRNRAWAFYCQCLSHVDYLPLLLADDCALTFLPGLPQLVFECNILLL